MRFLRGLTVLVGAIWFRVWPIFLFGPFGIFAGPVWSLVVPFWGGVFPMRPQGLGKPPDIT